MREPQDREPGGRRSIGRALVAGVVAASAAIGLGVAPAAAQDPTATTWDDTTWEDETWDDTTWDDTTWDDTTWDDGSWEGDPSATSLYIDPELQDDYQFLEDLLIESGAADDPMIADDMADGLSPEVVARLNDLLAGPDLTREQIAAPIDDPGDLDDTALAEAIAFKLLLATDALAELDAFSVEPDPVLARLVRDIRDDVPSDGAEDIDYVHYLADFAAEYPLLLTHLELRGIEPSEQLWLIDDLAAVGVFDDVDGSAPIESFDFVLAIADLALRNGELPNVFDDPILELVAVGALADRVAGDEPEIPATTTTTAPPATVATSETVPEALALDDTDAGALAALPLAAVGGGGVLAMVVAASAVVGLRRRRDGDPALTMTPDPAVPPVSPAATAPTTSSPTGSAPTSAAQNAAPAATAPAPPPGFPALAVPPAAAPMSLLLDVNRRLTESLDPGRVATAAVTEALRLTDADAGLLVRRAADQLVAVEAQPPAPFALDRLDRSGLRRVVETGRGFHRVTDDEAVLVRVPMAMAASAIVTNGQVLGALLVVRDPARPFRRTDVDNLEVLAELAGSALAAADTHGAATEVEPLTGLKNRRRLDRDLGDLADQLYPGDRHRTTAYLMVDVDHFKTFNDTNGHAAGDDALRAVARVLRDNVRPRDLVYRYGGEEFAVLLPETTAVEAAEIAERLRAAVEQVAVPGVQHQPMGRLTISIGAADTDDGGVDDLVERADAALYAAKHGGRNQVRIHGGG